MTTVSSSGSSYASSALSDYQSRQKALFSKLDTDQDGKLTESEFVAGRPGRATEEQAATLYSKMDATGSGSLSEDDFLSSSDSAPSMGPLSQMSGDAAAAVMSMQPAGGTMFAQQSVSDLYASMDSDSDGTVTETEFLSARPADVSEEQAKTLYSSIDTSGTGSITEDQFAASLTSQEEQRQADASDAAAKLFKSIDTDGDGKVTESEFLAGRPDDMTEDQAKELYGTLDSDSTGSITEQQLADSMTAAGNPPPPPPGNGGGGGGDGGDETSEIYDALDTNKDGVVSQSEFLAAMPTEMSTTDAQSVYQSIDTDSTGSISEAQLDEFLKSIESAMQSAQGGTATQTSASA
jgi:Ca2+-binding EF-hand superfamily protein